MSVKVMSLVWQRATDIQGNDLIVLLALADWSNDVGICWPSVPALAAKSRISERTVRYILSRLTEAGYIQVQEQRGRNHTNHYLINMQRLQVLEPENMQNLQVIELQNLQSTTENLQVATLKPAIAIAPEPSIEPSIEPSYSDTTKKRKGKKPMTDCPDNFALTDDLYSKAKKAGFRGDRQYMEVVFDTFLNHHASRGTQFADWNRAWLTWVGKSVSYGEDVPKVNGGYNGSTQGRLGTDQQGGPRQLEVQKSARPGKSFGRHLADVG